MHHYDVLIIGTGTAGDTAATILSNAGLRVAIADEREFGGTCALRGCQPKKYLVVPAHAALEGAALTARGLRHAPELNYQSMQRSRAEFTGAIPAGVEAGFAERGIDAFHGTCCFYEDGTVQCGDSRITAQRYLVVTGGRPRPLSISGGELAMSSDDFLAMQDLPRDMVFIGGGYIAMEFATVAVAAGVHVTILQRGSRVMERFDPDLVGALMDSCSSRSMNFVTDVETKALESLPDGQIRIAFTRHGSDDVHEIVTQRVVGAVGRIPNIEALNLTALGVSVSGRGIETDEHMQTAHPAIYAAGDCAVGVQLSPVSDHEARVAAANIIADLKPENEAGHSSADPERLSNADAERQTRDLSILPTVVFTYPQLAQFGMSERDATDRAEIRVVSGSGATWPNYRRLNEPHVRYKILIDTRTDIVVGAHILAPHAGELINTIALATRAGLTASQMRAFPWAYPTYSSDIKYMMG
jgi:glutathione reductase (NADPH)